jgi:TfoX/Sxy family transcriptional regulator of competence genes
MAYDEGLAERIRVLTAEMDGIEEKKMFGGIAFMRNGHMLVGLLKDELMARVGKAAHDDAVAEPHARIMDFTGRPMQGYIVVAPAGIDTDARLRAWIDRCVTFNDTLPPK